MGLWSPAIKNRIIHENGSVQNIPEVPDDLKAIYKYGQSVVLPFSFISFSSSFWYTLLMQLVIPRRTVWEIKQRTLIDMAVDRGCYIDQSQSLNIHTEKPTFDKLTSLHFYAWEKVFL